MNWIVPIMGFTESVTRRTGIEKIWAELRSLSSATTTVLMPWEWRDDMRALAEFLVRNSWGHDARVMVVAYSWGAGYAFPRFARHAERLGIAIETACLCDPVYRSGLLPWWLPLNPLALLRCPTIRIPASVERVLWMRQHLDFAVQGHELAPEDPDVTEILQPEILLTTHSRIDDSRAFHDMVMREASRFLRHERKGAR